MVRRIPWQDFTVMLTVFAITVFVDLIAAEGEEGLRVCLVK